MDEGNVTKKVSFIFNGLTWSKHVYYLKRVPRSCSTLSCNHQNSLEGRLNGTSDDCHVQVPAESVNNTISAEHEVDFGRTVGRIPEEQYKRILMPPDQPSDARSLKVAIIGAPNSGKSTLVNKLLGWKVNAVSSKVHTTRKNTNAVFSEGNTQILFVDTPGVLTSLERKHHKCEGNMVTDPERSLHEADIVGVVVDVANKWTRNKLNVEVLKVLHLHTNVPSFLILNKVDALKWKQLMLETTRRLTMGVVAGKEIVVSNRVIPKPKNKTEKIDLSLFEHLESKYGKVNRKEAPVHKKLSEETVGDISSEDKVWMKDFMGEVNIKDETENKSVEAMDGSNSEIDGDKNLTAIDVEDKTVVKELDSSCDNDSIQSELDFESPEAVTGITEDSYQSDFLSQIQSKPALAHLDSNSKETLDEFEEFDWTEKVSKIKEATEAARKKHGWENFDRVFLVSALHGDGIDDLRMFLLETAREGDWTYHSSLVTDQDPHEMAKMCVWQCVLDNCFGVIPYKVFPDITYWEVDDNNRLNIVMELQCSNTYWMKHLIGPEGNTIKAITAQARQALLDAFQCEVRFKLVIMKVRKRK